MNVKAKFQPSTTPGSRLNLTCKILLPTETGTGESK